MDYAVKVNVSATKMPKFLDAMRACGIKAFSVEMSESVGKARRSAIRDEPEATPNKGLSLASRVRQVVLDSPDPKSIESKEVLTRCPEGTKGSTLYGVLNKLVEDGLRRKSRGVYRMVRTSASG